MKNAAPVHQGGNGVFINTLQEVPAIVMREISELPIWYLAVLQFGNGHKRRSISP